jgi:hypothetical protein
MTQATNHPVEVIRDGALKVSIFAHSSDKGVRYSAVLIRSYRDEKDGSWKDSPYLGNGEMLRAARLWTLAYDRIVALKAESKNAVDDEAQG